ncbi:MAG: alanine racemase [bacterium]
MTGNKPKTWIEVSAKALVSNVGELKRQSSGSSLMAVVKSNAYGHGTAAVVKAVDGVVDWFGVDSLVEAEEVRRSGSRRPVLILGYTPVGSLCQVVSHGFSQVTYSRRTADAMSHFGSVRRPAKLQVKVETGTSRQGVDLEDLPTFFRFLSKLKNVKIEGLYTHFANVEDTTDPTYAKLQLRRFRKAVDIAEKYGIRPPVIHAACSAAAIIYPETHFDLVRTGISLYGLWSSKVTQAAAAETGINLRLRPALTWKTTVAQVKNLSAGTPVSYGLTEKVRRPSRVAVLPIGYWDGFDRRLSSIGNVLVRGHRAKVIGRVCMNMCVVDVTDIRGAREGDEAVILGRQGQEEITAEELADRIGTINYDVVTGINPLLPRYLV